MNKIPDDVKSNIYKDGFQPTVQELGKTIALIPRTINAILAPYEKWLYTKEVSTQRIKELIAEKVASKPLDDLTPPEPYVAFPALQALSYSIDSDILRNAYANLLSAAIDINTKDFVHPSFVESLKQLSPVDVKVFDSVLKHKLYALVDLVSYAAYENGYPVTQYLLETNISGLDISDHLIQGASFNLLSRLGFIEIRNASMSDDSYAPIYASKEYNSLLEKHSDYPNLNPSKKHFIITDLGDLFAQICFDS